MTHKKDKIKEFNKRHLMKLITIYVLISLWIVPLFAEEKRHQNERIGSSEAKMKSSNEIKDMKKWQFSIDASILWGSLAFAKRESENLSTGIKVGVGLMFSYYSSVDNEHLSQGELIDVLWIDGFVRQRLNQFEIDYGIRGGISIHDFGNSGNFGAALFYGGLIDAVYGWKYFKVGSRIMKTHYWEDEERAGWASLQIIPVIVRLSISF